MHTEKQNYGWLSPTGKFIQVHGIHTKITQKEYVKKMNGIRSIGNGLMRNPQRYVLHPGLCEIFLCIKKDIV